MTQEKDLTFKFISTKHIEVIVDLLKLDDDFDFSDVEVLTAEQINVEHSLRRPDLIVRIGDKILMIEFQSSDVSEDDLRRFIMYISSFDEQINKGKYHITFCILSTSEKSRHKEYKMFNSNILEFPIVSMLDLNVREIINSIEHKIENNEKISDDELIKLALTPISFKKRDDIEKQFYEALGVINRINSMSEDIRNSVSSIILMLSNMYFKKDDPFRKKLQGDLMFEVDCVQELAKERYDQGIDEGIEEVIINFLKSGNLSDEEIAMNSNISLDKVLEIKSKIQINSK